MNVVEFIWGEWNTAHITKHGGSQDLAEQVLRDPAVTVITAHRLAQARATVVTKDWTVVFNFEPIQGTNVRAYPITMYPTKRGSRTTHRRKP